MRKFFVLTLTLVLASFAVTAQNNNKAMDNALSQIPNIFKQGDASALKPYFGSSVSIEILNTESMYSKDQAVQVMKEFFTKYRPKNFVTPYKSGGQQLKFIVGTLTTQSDEHMRVSIFVKQDGDSVLIQKLIIEKE